MVDPKQLKGTRALMTSRPQTGIRYGSARVAWVNLPQRPAGKNTGQFRDTMRTAPRLTAIKSTKVATGKIVGTKGGMSKARVGWRTGKSFSKPKAVGVK